MCYSVVLIFLFIFNTLASKTHSIGAVVIESIPYNVLAEDSRFVGRILGTSIFQVSKIQINPMITTLSAADCQRRSPAALSIVHSFLSSAGFFYSACQDNSKCYRLWSSMASHYSPKQVPEKGYEDYFVANSHMISTYNQYAQNAEPPVKVIWGQVQMGCFNIADELVCAALINRTSTARTGPRLYSRGSNTHGHVSNTCEVESILSKGRDVASFVQFRGSIPLLWSQLPEWTTYFAPVKIEKEVEDPKSKKKVGNLEAFDAHVAVMKKLYPDMKLKFLSLLESRHGSFEKALADAYQKVVESSRLKSAFEYCSYEVTSEMAADNEVVDPLQLSAPNWFLSLVDKANLDQIKFSLYANGKLVQDQKELLRCSCLSTLDRTSAVQKQVSDHISLEMLRALVPTAQSCGHLPRDLQEWMSGGFANVANRISEQYAGTKAKKNDIIRTGKSGIFGRLMDYTVLSFKRHINANYYDRIKNGAMQTVFGRDAVSLH